MNGNIIRMLNAYNSGFSFSNMQPLKNQRLPLSVARPMMKKQKQREEKMLQEVIDFYHSYLHLFVKLLLALLFLIFVPFVALSV